MTTTYPLHPLTVTLHQGHQGIGGSLFEVARRNGERVILDLGLPLYENGEPLGLDWARLARDPETGLAQLRRKGIPPPGLGLFRDELPRLCAGIFITHAHLDHWGLLPFLRDGLRVYTSAVTRRLIQWQCLWQGVRLPRIDWRDFEESVFVCPQASGDPQSLKVQAIPVNHSVPGALAYRVESGEGAHARRMAYTGDFRFRRDSLDAFKLGFHLRRHLELLLVEGTHLGPAPGPDRPLEEEDVVLAFQRSFQRYTGLVSIAVSALHQDRLNGLARAASFSGRQPVLDLYAALARRASGRSLAGFRVLFTKAYMQRIERRRQSEPELARTYLHEGVLADCQARAVRLRQIQDEPGAYVLLLRAGLLKDLQRYADKGWATLPRPDLHLHSLWKGYRSSGDALEAWLKRQNVPVRDLGVHASGHVDSASLQSFVHGVAAQRTVAVHSPHPEALKHPQAALSVLTHPRREAALERLRQRGFTLRDWVGEQVKVFRKGKAAVSRIAARRGFLDEEVNAALLELHNFAQSR